jgi:hypothetical protein
MIRSMTIKGLIDDGDASEVIPLPDITSTTFAKIVEFLKHLNAGKCCSRNRKTTKYQMTSEM